MKVTNIQAVSMARSKCAVEKSSRCVSNPNRDSENVALPAHLSFNQIKSIYNVSFRSEAQSIDLIKASETGNLIGIEAILVDPEVDVNYVDEGWTALGKACRYSRYDAISRLLQHPDIDINKQMYNKRTALIIAAGNNNIYAVKELIKIPEIDLNNMTEGKDTALTMAIDREYSDVVSELLKCPNLDVNTRDSKGRTPLIIALSSGNNNEDSLGIINALLDREDIDINAKSNERQGNCALEAACFRSKRKENYDIIERILNKPNININAQDNDGHTSLMIACCRGLDDVVNRLLQEKNIDLTLKDKSGYTALDYARRTNLSEAIINKMITMAKDQYLSKTTNPQIGSVSRAARNVDMGRKIPVDINLLSAENNIWSEKEIKEYFSNLVKNRQYQDALNMLEKTPLVDFEADNKDLIVKVSATGNPEFIEKVFDYKFHKQEKMRDEYNAKRKDFLENKIPTLSYEELLESNVVLNTRNGYEFILNKAEFNPNDVSKGKSLFEYACEVDSSVDLAKQILQKYDDVETANAKKINNNEIKSIINEYENGGKYGVKLSIIKANLQNRERRNEVVEQLKDFILSDGYKPEISDSFGNTALHVAMCAPADNTRSIIQKIIDKGGDINAKNIAGQTPLMLAIKSLIVEEEIDDRSNLLANIKFLLDKGVKINEQDKHGQTAFYYTCCTTSSALLNLMLSFKPDVFIEDFKGNRPHINLKTPQMKEIYRTYILR